MLRFAFGRMHSARRISLLLGCSLLSCLLCASSCRPERRTICLDGPRCPDAGVEPLDDDASARVVSRGQACAMQSVRAMRGPGKTVDVVFVVDNSSSMEEEITAVRANINQNFAAIVQAGAVDL